MFNPKFQVALLLLVVAIVHSEPILNPDATYKQSLLPFNNYDLNTNQQLLLKYQMYHQFPSDAYDTNLYYTLSPSESNTFDTYLNYSLAQAREFPCKLTKPQVTLQPVAKIANLNNQNVFSSMIAIGAQDIDKSAYPSKEDSDKNSVYIGRSFLVTTDYLLKIVDMMFINKTQNQRAKDFESLDSDVLNITMSDQFIDLTQYLTINDTFYYFPYLLNYEALNVAYIITPYGALRFKSNSSQPDIVKISNYIPRRDLNYVHVNQQKGFILTANGAEGVDIFNIDSNGDLELLSTIPPNVGPISTSGFANDVNIVDVNMDASNSMLFALDKISGLQFFDIFNPAKPVRQNFDLPIPKGKAFDHYFNTFVIVFSIDNGKDVAAEIFIEFEHGGYYVNNIYTHTQQITDVEMTRNFLVLMGSDMNTIIQHSIYNKLYNMTDKLNTNFQEYEVSQVSILSFISPEDQTTHQFLIGLGHDMLKIFLYKEQPPIVQCKTDKPIRIGLAVEMKSQSCDLSSDYKGPYFQCTLVHYFNLNYEGVILDSRNKKLALGLGLGLGLTALLIIIIALFCYCKQKRRLALKESTYNSYQNIEIPEKEMIG